MSIGLDRIIALNPWQIFLEGSVITPQLFVIQDKQGSPMLFNKFGNLFFYSHLFISYL
jgi:hypothetical protein